MSRAADRQLKLEPDFLRAVTAALKRCEKSFLGGIIPRDPGWIHAELLYSTWDTRDCDAVAAALEHLTQTGHVCRHAVPLEQQQPYRPHGRRWLWRYTVSSQPEQENLHGTYTGSRSREHNHDSATELVDSKSNTETAQDQQPVAAAGAPAAASLERLQKIFQRPQSARRQSSARRRDRH
jgi:hypothetical protein